MVESIIKRQRRKYLSTFFVLVIILFLAVFFDLSTGPDGFSLKELERIICLDQLDKWYVFMNLRLPRVLTALVMGVILALGGIIMQNILKNPLATPFTIGISHAAAFGASFAIIILGVQRVNTQWQLYLVLFCALLSSLLCLGIIMLLSLYAKLSASSIILAGISISALFHALTMFTQYFADDTQLASAVVWTFGDISKTNYKDISILFAFTLPIYLYFQYKANDYNALAFGDSEAKNLGINTRNLQIISIFLASLLTALATSFVGVVAFIGLVAPHLVRIILKNDYRILIPFSVMTGAIILILADICSKILLAPIDIPIGILTPFIGTPMLIYLITKKVQ